jgi:hypothetical protein
MIGQIRIGRRIYDRSGKATDPSFDNFTPILCLTKSSAYGSLGPYFLKDDKNRLMENIWQASKVYPNVPKTTQNYSRYDRRVIWSHGAEKHVENGQILPAYWVWREKLMNNPDPVRYPVGYDPKARASCLFALEHDQNSERLDYVAARKKIYFKVYKELVVKAPQFTELFQRLQRGENLLIIEVDGPHEECLDYYKTCYGVDNNFIVHETILCTKRNMDILINDTKHPFGHGYCLAMVLSGLEPD